MTAPAERLAVGSPVELAALVPHLLGFVPHESLVLVGMAGPRRRIGLTLRVDLPDPADELPQLAHGLAAQVRRSGASEAVAVVVTERPGDHPDLPYRSLVGHVGDAIPLCDGLLLRAGRCWSYQCDDLRCCPADGRPLDADDGALTRIRAVYAGLGNAVLPSREAVVDTLRPETGERAQAVQAALPEAVLWRRRRGQARVAGWALSRLDREVAAHADPRATLEPAAAARFGVALRDIPTRDAVLARWARAVTASPADRELADAWRRLLLDLARLLPAPYDAQPLVLFACAAYHAGSGVLVEAAAERAQRHDPGCSMAGLLLEVLDRQLPPAVVVEGLAVCFGPDGAGRD